MTTLFVWLVGWVGSGWLQAHERCRRCPRAGSYCYGVKLVHIAWPDDDLLSNAVEFENLVQGSEFAGAPILRVPRWNLTKRLSPHSW